MKQLAYLIKKAQAFVGGDTGPMHLAAAVGTSVVAMFGPTDPLRNGPYGKQHIVLTAPVLCTGCWKRTCPKGEICLDKIDPDTVYEAVQRVIKIT